MPSIRLIDPGRYCQSLARKVAARMVGLVALYTAILASKTVPFKQLPESVIQVLGSNVVVTPIALDWLDVKMSLSYSVLSHKLVVRTSITGAILAGSHEQVSEQFYILKSQLGWSPRTYILIVSSVQEMKYLKGRMTGRVANILFYNDFLYVLNPFRHELIKVSDDKDLKQVLNSRWRNLFGYSPVVAIYKHTLGYIDGFDISPGSGTDATALYELTKYWNMSPILHTGTTADHQLELPNEEIISEKIQFSMNPRFMIGGELDDYVEFTSTVLSDAVIIVMKKPPKLRGWEVFAKIFNWKMLITLLITMVVTSGLMMLSPGKRDITRVIFLTLRCIFSIPMKRMPHHHCERLLMGPTMLLSTVIVNAYLACLYHLTEVGQTKQEIKTLQEFSKKGIPLLAVRSGLSEYFWSSDCWDVKNLGSNILVNSYIDDQLLETNAYVMREKELKFLVDTHVIGRNIYIIDEKVVRFTMSYVIKRGSLFYEPLCEFASRVFEAGLRDEWYTMTVEKVNMANRGNVEYKFESHDRKRLSLQDTEVAFFAVMSGLKISCIIFLLEILCKHLMNPRTKREAARVPNTNKNKHKFHRPYIV